MTMYDQPGGPIAARRVVSYVWTSPRTGERLELHPADVAIVYEGVQPEVPDGR